ncbi:similar to TRICHOME BIREFRINGENCE-LIKE 11 [Actinidia rufa]|uniref:Similar to TRICHOME BIREFRINGENCE-LIKE 11 n=1 Tax=Actinidia rufa TaxID=165716 RepID=A0A7J0E7E4_9ERIC|nr:similar to TRICHOME BIREFRINGENCE-LIKE 11 [Actinidia rufa]
MLERLRNKRLVFVGDSITRNQWASMVCLLDSSISPVLKSVTANRSITAFKIKDYNASIEHYWAPYLVESNSDSDHPMNHRFSQEQILGVHAIEKHARHWTNADILVFNSHRWWRRPKVKVLWGSFESPDRNYEEMETRGKWVYDEKAYPLYKENHCSFIDMFNGIACERAGRMDSKYQHWRWQPHDCDLPRFNAKAMLERLRGKRLVFVGDSIVRNQWASMVCLLESSISPDLKSVTPNGSITTFKIKDYNASIEHYWSPYLVESNSDNPVNHPFSQEQILGVHAIEKHARHWTNADILVFNSHRGEDWGKAKGENCFNETEPILKEGYHGRDLYPGLRRMVENAINGLKRKGLTVQMIDITQLSDYRKDAHTSIYRKMWGRITKEQIANPKSHADCLHWCIPGVPDTWNELLYAYIFHF